jgi:hypothetical protein
MNSTAEVCIVRNQYIYYIWYTHTYSICTTIYVSSCLILQEKKEEAEEERAACEGKRAACEHKKSPQDKKRKGKGSEADAESEDDDGKAQKKGNSEIVGKLGEMWRGMSCKEKEPWEEKARGDKDKEAKEDKGVCVCVSR